VRGADTEDQLLELQRAFLASTDHRATAAARVTRVGGAPPRAPTAEEAAGVLPEDIARAENDASTAAASARSGGGSGGGRGWIRELRAAGSGISGSYEEEAAAAGYGHYGDGDEGGGGGGGGQGSLVMKVGEIVERARPSAAPNPPQGPTPPMGGAGLAFPAATHRSNGPFAGRKSKFMLEREARAGGGGGSGGSSGGGGMGSGGGGAAGAPMGTPGTVHTNPNGSTVTFVRATPVGNKAPDPEAGLYKLISADSLACESAWFQLLSLSSDEKPVSKFAFTRNLYRLQ
jgi:hypothetical protein